MFHQADDIQLYLSPYELSEPSAVKAAAAAQPIASADFMKRIKAAMRDRAQESRKTFDFLEENGFCAMVRELDVDPDKVGSSEAAACFTNPVAAYDVGLNAFKRGQIAEAVRAFAVMASQAELQASALAGLAACACFQGKYDIALLFAQESIECKEHHPRIYLIAGYSALKSGDKKTAKRQLALTTRLARGDTRDRDAQRCAQRELLLMQLAS